MFFEEATEPTNIIWENRFLTSSDRFKRSMHAFLVIFLLVLVSFGIISACKTVTVTISNTYDASDCTSLTNAYGNHLLTYAFDEYRNESLYENYSLTGVL